MGVTEYNQKIIKEFRANHGVVGGPFAGASLLLLHNKGAKSGAARINPLAYFADGDNYLIVASYQGSDKNPPWYHNLLIHPNAQIEVGDDTIDVLATSIPEPERTTTYARIAAAAPAFAEYQKKTDRQIPIMRLTPG